MGKLFATFFLGDYLAVVVGYFVFLKLNYKVGFLAEQRGTLG